MAFSTDQKGAIAESAIVHAAIKLGIGVFRPLSDGERYDLILDLGSKLVRVQCKWASLLLPDGMARCAHDDPTRFRPARNNQRNRINWADDFAFEDLHFMRSGP